jgi:hypothetical protein
MSRVYLLQNQQGLYFTKKNEWSAEVSASLLYRTEHHDIALNTLLEINAKDIELRGKIVEVECDEKGLPILSTTSDNLRPHNIEIEQTTGETTITEQTLLTLEGKLN